MLHRSPTLGGEDDDVFIDLVYEDLAFRANRCAKRFVARSNADLFLELIAGRRELYDRSDSTQNFESGHVASDDSEDISAAGSGSVPLGQVLWPEAGIEVYASVVEPKTDQPLFVAGPNFCNRE